MKNGRTEKRANNKRKRSKTFRTDLFSRGSYHKMRKTLFISLLSLFLVESSFGQEFKFKSINDSLELDTFHSYINSIFELNKDDSLPDSFNEYAIVYKTYCHNDEVLDHDRISYTTEGKSFINDSMSFNTQESVFTHPLTKYTPYYCAEKPSKLLDGLPVIAKKQILVTTDSLVIETIRISNEFSEYTTHGFIQFSSFTSFMNSKYLVIEFFKTTGIGSQTSPGITETLFLERIE